MNNDMFIHRRKAGLRQLDIARKLNLSEQCISNYETGRSAPSVKVAERIGKVLGVQPRKLFPELYKQRGE